MPYRYEFEEGYLVSQVSGEDPFLPTGTDRADAFEQLSRALASLNADLPARLRSLRLRGEAFMLSGHIGSDPVCVGGRPQGGRLILTVWPGAAAEAETALTGVPDETADLRTALDIGPCAIWKQDDQGRIVWANTQYLALVERNSGAENAAAKGWPLPAVFGDQLQPMPSEGTLRRCRLDCEDADAPRWFEVSVRRKPEGAVFCVARPVDRLVAAETSRRDFVQTLSKTFATLPIGVLGHGYETVLCAGYAAIMITVAASASRPFCSALI